MRKGGREAFPDLPSVATLATLVCMGGWAGDLQKPLHQHFCVYGSLLLKGFTIASTIKMFVHSISFLVSSPVIACSGATYF